MLLFLITYSNIKVKIIPYCIKIKWKSKNNNITSQKLNAKLN